MVNIFKYFEFLAGTLPPTLLVYDFTTWIGSKTFQHFPLCTLSHLHCNILSVSEESGVTAWSSSHQSPRVLFWEAPTSRPCMKVNILPSPCFTLFIGPRLPYFAKDAWDHWTPGGLLSREHITVLTGRLKTIRNWRKSLISAHANVWAEHRWNTGEYKYMEDTSWIGLKWKEPHVTSY